MHEAFVSIIGTVYELIVMKLHIEGCDSVFVFIFKYPRAVVFKLVRNTGGDLRSISGDYQYHCWISDISKFSLQLGARHSSLADYKPRSLVFFFLVGSKAVYKTPCRN
jgi:hypothetical protein